MTVLAIASLSDLHRRVLRFERRWYALPGAKVEAIRATFGLLPVSYYRVLANVVELPAALAFDPQLVNRIRRAQQRGMAARRWRL